MSIRTTLTLDDDVAHLVAAQARRSGRPVRVVVNDALRRGLSSPPADAGPFVVDARDLGLRPGLDTDDVESLLDRVEGPGRP